MKKLVFMAAAIIICLMMNAQVKIDYFLPQDLSYNPQIPVPSKSAGHEIGELHLTHDKLIYYMQELAEISNRAIWEDYGRSHEGRPLGHLIISSEENIRNIEKIRQQHLILCDPARSGEADITEMPLFVKLGYGIHGNESSAQNASSLVAYYLVAGEGGKIDDLLKSTIILIDPALNPDGMQRHSTWVNSTKSLNNNSDPNSWEFTESWPGGRTNHYWFDLNRDYIMLQQPESVGRVWAFYKWRPNINTDHHEMGANSTFFFQPGIQSRNNPLTPVDNQLLTAEIGHYHEKFLNETGSLYFTEEAFDDYYVGKGSSYPDIHGSIGILFEQAGVKGHLKEVQGGLLTFPFAIRNQFTVSLSTLEAGYHMRRKLLENQRDFYKSAMTEADKFTLKGYVFTDPTDKKRLSEFIRILLRHQIKVFSLDRNISKNGVEYRAGESYYIPLKQPEYRFIRSLFESVDHFTDSLFYDVSTWVLPMSFNISYSGLNTSKETDGLMGSAITQPPPEEGRLIATGESYAYLFEWNEYLAPAALYRLQDKGIICRVSKKKFKYDESDLNREFSYGTIMIPVSGQILKYDELAELMASTAKDYGIIIYGVRTGLTAEGPDLGSNELAVLEKPSVMMFTGDGISGSDAGEIWHMMDTRFNMPVSMVRANMFSGIELSRYNVLIVAGFPEVNQTGIDNIKSWIRNGGTVIGYKEGNRWLSEKQICKIEFIPSEQFKNKDGVYAMMSDDSQFQQIPGSIFETIMDLTHPLCYGYTREKLPVFKSGKSVAKKDENIYNNPVSYTVNPLLSGYCSRENLERIKGTSFVSVHGKRIISIYDNTNFRAIWYGTNKIFLNAVFFGQIL